MDWLIQYVKQKKKQGSKDKGHKVDIIMAVAVVAVIEEGRVNSEVVKEVDMVEEEVEHNKAVEGEDNICMFNYLVQHSNIYGLNVLFFGSK